MSVHPFLWYRPTIPKVRYSESPLCRYAPCAKVWVKVKVKVRIRVRVRFRVSLRVRLRVSGNSKLSE